MRDRGEGMGWGGERSGVDERRGEKSGQEERGEEGVGREGERREGVAGIVSTLYWVDVQ